MLQSFAFCYHTQRLRTVWVEGTEGEYLRLVPEEGALFRYRPKQLLHRWEAEGPPLDEATAHDFLRERTQALEASALQVDLRALHGKLPVDEELALDRIAHAANLQDASPWAMAALYLALARDTARFRRGDRGFAARPETEQQQRITRMAEAADQQAWVAKATAWAKALEQSRWLGTSDPEGARFLAQLTSLLALGKHSPHWAALGKPLGLPGQSPDDAPVTLKRWLQTADAWPGWPAVWLVRAGVQPGFSPVVMEATRQMAVAPPRTVDRTDLRGVPTYALDAIDTFDYDDAYSVLDADAAGLTIAIHIAEPPPEMTPGHPVFDMAAERISSVYTPQGIYPMLPPALSLGRCSLQKGEPREVVTCRLRLTTKGAELLGFERALIQVAENLDYARSEELMRSAPETWGRLSRLAEMLTQQRVANGAMVSVRREVKLDLSDPARVKLERTSRHGGVHRVIEELAIAYNSAVGRYCEEHGLPAFFRVQNARKPTAQASPAAPPMLPPARYSLKGGRHAGLGAERYVHATSPLRRFPDLVTQRQLISHVTTGKAAFQDQALLEKWVSQAEARQSAYDDVERAIDEHWVRVYLSQNPGLTMQATVRRNEHGHGRVWLEDVLLTADAKLPPYSRPGGQVTVRVTEVDIDTQRVQVEAIS